VVIVGLLVIDTPVPAAVPPHEPVYQRHIAPVPNVPPETVRVDEVPEHTTCREAVAEVGAVEGLFTITVIVAHVVVLHVPSART